MEQVGGYPVSITRTLLASVAAGSGALQACALQLSSWMQEICEQPSLHTVLSILGVWYQDQSILFTPELVSGHLDSNSLPQEVLQWIPHEINFRQL